MLDPLTGLLNRAVARRRACAEIEQQAQLTGGAASRSILLDLDRFKRVNDTYGHERGDAVLRDVAYEIRKSLRSFELVYRIGGEEFLVLLPGVDLAEALEMPSGCAHCRVRPRGPASLDLTRLRRRGRRRLAASISYDVLFRAADAASLQAKREGRDRVDDRAAGCAPIADPGRTPLRDGAPPQRRLRMVWPSP